MSLRRFRRLRLGDGDGPSVRCDEGGVNGWFVHGGLQDRERDVEFGASGDSGVCHAVAMGIGDGYRERICRYGHWGPPFFEDDAGKRPILCVPGVELFVKEGLTP